MGGASKGGLQRGRAPPASAALVEPRLSGWPWGTARSRLFYRFPAVERWLAWPWVRLAGADEPDLAPPAPRAGSPTEIVTTGHADEDGPLVLPSPSWPAPFRPTPVRSALQLRILARRDETRSGRPAKLAGGPARYAAPSASSPDLFPGRGSTVEHDGHLTLDELPGMAALAGPPVGLLRWNTLPKGVWVKVTDQSLLELDHRQYRIRIGS